MKRKLLLAIGMIFWMSITSAQEKNVDSLFTIWSDTTQSARNRVEAYFQRFDPFDREVGEDPEAYRWGPGIKEVQQLAKETGQEAYIPRFMILEGGYNYMYLNQREKGCTLAKEALELAILHEDYQVVLAAYLFIETCWFSNIQIKEEELDNVIEVIKKMEIKKEHSQDQIKLYLILAFYHYDNSDYPRAMEFSLKIVNYFEQVGNLSDPIYEQSLRNIGNIHSHLGNWKEAEALLLQSIGILLREHPEKKIRLSGAYIDLALVHIGKKDILNAQRYLDKSLSISEKDPNCLPCNLKAKRVKAGIENLAENHSEALDILLPLKDAYKSPDILTHFTMKSLYFAELAGTYLSLKQYQLAIQTCEEGLEVAKGNLYASVENYRVLYQTQEALGNYQAAFSAYQKFTNTRDSITQFQNSQQVNRLELENQYAELRLADSLAVAQQNLDRELAFQKQLNQQKNNRNILLGLGLLAFLLALGLFSRLRYTRRAEEQLKEKNRLIEAEKEKAKASERAKHQFLANMSHEIRTPMNAIKGMTDILLRRDPKVEQQEFLDGIKQSSDSLLVIINDILDLSKIEAGKIELEEAPFTILEVLQSVGTIMQFKAEEKGLELKINSSEALAPVVGDPTRLRQVLINLVGNGIKFTNKGLVSISTQVLHNENGKMELQFTVSDTGVGIGEDRLEKIFDSFEQAYSDTSRKFGGTGLGLSISKKLVELHGGRIWAESDKGKGSLFHFTIPYLLAPAGPMLSDTDTIDNRQIVASQLQGTRILLVEDNAFNAIVAQEELEDAIEEVSVEVAENGAIAVEKLKTGDFDIILMDVQMPIMNGYEATQKIRTLPNGKSGTPVIAMTANVLKEEVARCYEAGMDDFIGKPFATKELIQKIQRLTKVKGENMARLEPD